MWLTLGRDETRRIRTWTFACMRCPILVAHWPWRRFRSTRCGDREWCDALAQAQPCQTFCCATARSAFLSFSSREVLALVCDVPDVPSGGALPGIPFNNRLILAHVPRWAVRMETHRNNLSCFMKLHTVSPPHHLQVLCSACITVLHISKRLSTARCSPARGSLRFAVGPHILCQPIAQVNQEASHHEQANGALCHGMIPRCT